MGVLPVRQLFLDARRSPMFRCLPAMIAPSMAEDGMATQQGTVDFLLDQMGGASTVSARKMFGDYGIYCEGKMVALVCDEQLFIKPTVGGRAFAPALAEAPPYPGAKP